MTPAEDKSGLREPGIESLLVELIDDADTRLKESHEWLLQHADLLEQIVSGAYPRRGKQMPLRRAYQNFHAWATDMCWFFHGTGLLAFDTICESMGIDLAAAREQRAQYRTLPVSSRQLWDGLEALGARG